MRNRGLGLVSQVKDLYPASVRTTQNASFVVGAFLFQPCAVTPLMVACQSGHLPVVRTLLASGASVNQATTHGSTALHAASQEGHDEVVAALLSAGADVHRLRTVRSSVPGVPGPGAVPRASAEHTRPVFVLLPASAGAGQW